MDLQKEEQEADLFDVLNFQLEKQRELDYLNEKFPENCIGFPMFQLQESQTVFQQLQVPDINSFNKELLLNYLLHSFNESILKIAKEYAIPFQSFQNNFDKTSILKPVYDAILNLYKNEAKKSKNCFLDFVDCVIRQKLLGIKNKLDYANCPSLASEKQKPILKLFQGIS